MVHRRFKFRNFQVLERIRESSVVLTSTTTGFGGKGLDVSVRLLSVPPTTTDEI